MNVKLLILLPFFLLVACSGNAPLNVGVHPWIGYQAINIAEFKKILPEHITLKKNRTAVDTKEQFINGEIDAGYLTLDEVLLLNDQGLNLKVVLIADISFGADKVLSKEKVTTASDLLNKRIGYEKGAVGELVLHEFLNKFQVSLEDIQAVDIPYNQQLQAWRDEKVDLMISYAPVATHILKKGAEEVFSSRDMPNIIIDVLAVRENYLDANCNVIKDLTSSHFQGLELIKHDFQDSSYLLADNLGISQQDVILTMNDIILPNEASNAELLGQNMNEKIDRIAEVLKKSGLIQKVPSQKIIDSTCTL